MPDISWVPIDRKFLGNPMERGCVGWFPEDCLEVSQDSRKFSSRQTEGIAIPANLDSKKQQKENLSQMTTANFNIPDSTEIQII